MQSVSPAEFLQKAQGRGLTFRVEGSLLRMMGPEAERKRPGVADYVKRYKGDLIDALLAESGEDDAWEAEEAGERAEAALAFVSFAECADVPGLRLAVAPRADVEGFQCLLVVPCVYMERDTNAACVGVGVTQSDAVWDALAAGDRHTFFTSRFGDPSALSGARFWLENAEDAFWERSAAPALSPPDLRAGSTAESPAPIGAGLGQ